MEIYQILENSVLFIEGFGWDKKEYSLNIFSVIFI
jgi:hypothetical protein